MTNRATVFFSLPAGQSEDADRHRDKKAERTENSSALPAGWSPIKISRFSSPRRIGFHMRVFHSSRNAIKLIKTTSAGNASLMVRHTHSDRRNARVSLFDAFIASYLLCARTVFYLSARISRYLRASGDDDDGGLFPLFSSSFFYLLRGLTAE